MAVRDRASLGLADGAAQGVATVGMRAATALRIGPGELVLLCAARERENETK